jgi:hypothetical protein
MREMMDGLDYRRSGDSNYPAIAQGKALSGGQPCAGSISRGAAEGERQAGNVVGLLCTGGEGGGRSEHLANEAGRAAAARRFQRCFEPRGAEFGPRRIKRLGNAVAEHEQRVAGARTISAQR